MRLVPVILILVCFLLAGCAPSSGQADALIGKWSGDPILGNSQAERIFKNQLHVDLEFLPDRAFKMTMFQTQMEGQWKHIGQEVTLSIQTLGGQTFDAYDKEVPSPKPKLKTEGLKKPWRLVLQPDGSMKTVPQSAAEVIVVFRRIS